MDIKFTKKSKDFGCFSNFAPYSFSLEGKTWPTSEHYFQAKKFEGTKYEEMVRKQDTPGKAKKMGGRRDLPFRSHDWAKVKEGIMAKALKAKFSQNENIKKILLSTGDRKIIENNRFDNYWGCGGKGKGKNRLGILIMKLRDELRGGDSEKKRKKKKKRKRSVEEEVEGEDEEDGESCQKKRKLD